MSFSVENLSQTHKLTPPKNKPDGCTSSVITIWDTHQTNLATSPEHHLIRY